MYYECKQAAKSGDINMAALAKYTKRKDKNNSDRQSKATIDKPKSKQKKYTESTVYFLLRFFVLR